MLRTELAMAPGHRALRKGRASIPGGIYHLTVVVADRSPVFANSCAAHTACRCLHAGTMLREAHLLAWVLMPDHTHWLMQLGENAPLHDEVRRLKSAVASHVNRCLGRQGRLWEPAYYDRALRHDDDVLTVARYVVANPVRAGLVERIGDYPYWNVIWL